MTQQEKDEQYMRRALDEAESAFREGEIPVGAVVVCRDRIIARAHNLTETLHDVTAHAEMQAITAAADLLGGKYLNECTLYVTGTDTTTRFRCRRREARLPPVCPASTPSQGHRHRWNP